MLKIELFARSWNRRWRARVDEGFPFKGVLFLGLMLTEDGPKLLEYNVRFGDPETQAILVRLKTDLLSMFESIHNETLGSLRCCVVGRIVSLCGGG